MEAAKKITKIVDIFYFPFLQFIPLDFYRYAVCGGFNLVFDLFLYFVFYHFIFAKQNVDLFFVVLSPHIASLFVVFPITFTTGFLLNRYITFSGSNLPWRTQFFRYLLVGLGALLLSYLLMKLFVDYWSFYPTPSRLLIVVIAVLYSFISQKKFTFRTIRKTGKV